MPRWRARGGRAIIAAGGVLVVGLLFVALFLRPGASAPAASDFPTASTAAGGSPGAAGDTDHGITFGDVALFTRPKAIAAVPVTNTTDQVRSFTIRATFKNGGDIVAVADATVYDLLPKSGHVALLPLQGPIAAETSASAEVVNVITVAKTTTAAEVALAQKFGQAKVTADATATVTVPVTNSSSAVHSYVVGAAVWRADKLVGVATVTVSGLAPGKTSTISMRLFGEASGDKVTAWVDHVTK